jgi:PAT family beta-lactamase induction signal transducer AmpG
MNGTRKRLTVIAGLYVSQAIPLGFLIVAMPAILRREGMGLELTGLLAALALPWLVKFLWAPLIDRFGSVRWGHYRSWIIPLQSLTVLMVLAVSQLDLKQSMLWLIVAGAVFMLSSATQDIATDGLAVHTVREDERGRANGIQVGGYYFGQILGGGLVLVLYDRFGWTTALLTMAVLLALPLIPLSRFREPVNYAAQSKTRIDFAALRRFVKRPGATTWILILLVYRAGETMAMTMFNPMLVDGGLSLEAIGVTVGVVGSIGAFSGAMAGGWLIASIGRKTSLVMFGLLQAIALCAYLVPAGGSFRPGTIYLVVLSVAFAGGMATASLYTNMMDRCDPKTAATDFTLQQSLCAFGPLLGASLSGFSAARFGYSAHFFICATVALGSTLIVARWLTAENAAPQLSEPLADRG